MDLSDLYRDIVETSPDGIWVIDLGGRTIYANPAIARLHGVDEEAAEIAAMTKRAMTVVRDVSGAGGFNIGMNQGHIAGAGIAAHLHQHVVPRWPGDQNFMPIIGRTKTLPELLSDTRDLLARAWG